jgi:hypothetical protein
MVLGAAVRRHVLAREGAERPRRIGEDAAVMTAREETGKDRSSKTELHVGETLRDRRERDEQNAPTVLAIDGLKRIDVRQHPGLPELASWYEGRAKSGFTDDPLTAVAVSSSAASAALKMSSG